MPLSKIAVLLFNHAELLDFAGPLQVFAAFNYMYPEDCDSVTTIGIQNPFKVSKVGMNIETDLSIDEVDEHFNLLVIPGGMGTRELIKDEPALSKINTLIEKSDRVASVCTGSLVLAKLGLLSNKKATTHFAAVELLKKLDDSITVDRSKRYHDHDLIIVAEGVSAGIDMSFHLIKKYYGQEKHDEVKKYIEYYPEKQG